MPQALPVPPPGFDRLTVEEQIEYLEALWDHISANAEKVQIPTWHRQVIEARMNESLSGLDEKTWEEFEGELDKE